MADVWERIAAVVHRLGDFDDIVVGQALEQIDEILESEKLSWYAVAARIQYGAPTEAPAPPAAPPRAAPVVTSGRQPPVQLDHSGPGRKPSHWLFDKRDVEKAYAALSTVSIDSWTHEFIESLYEQIVIKGFKLSEKQRNILNDKMDRLGL